MKSHLLASAAALVLMTGGAIAQTTTTESTTVTAPSSMPAPAIAPAPVAPPPPGTLSTTETQKSVDANGYEYESTKTTYGSVNGAASQSVSTATLQPAEPEMVTTTKKTTTISTSN